MARKKKTTGAEISHENCVTKQLSEQKKNDLKVLAIAKQQEKAKFIAAKSRGNKIGLVPIPGSHGAFKQIEIR